MNFELIAKKFRDAGIAVIPANSDKTPLVKWGDFTKNLQDDQTLKIWGSEKPQGMAVLGGKVSRGVLCIDLDTKVLSRPSQGAKIKELEERIDEVFQVREFLCQKTPSGGRHYVFRTSANIGNRKIAMVGKKECLIETRGEGGYFLVKPSENYEILWGNWSKLPQLDNSETDELLEICKSMSTWFPSPAEPRVQTTYTGKTPFDDFKDKTTDEEVLSWFTSAGWTVLGKANEGVYLRRPGKKKGISATYNYTGQRTLHCFSTSTEFEENSSFAMIYATIFHNGNINEAAKDLAKKGFGEKKGTHYDCRSERPTLTPKRNGLIFHSQKELDKSALDIQKHGFEKGFDLGIPSINSEPMNISILKGQLNIVTGSPNSGKSEFTEQCIVHFAKTFGWRGLLFIPETWPSGMIIHRMIQKYAKKKTLGSSMTDNEFKGHLKWFHEHFKICHTEEEQRFTDIQNEISKGFYDFCLVDPWNELDDERSGISETDYTKNALKSFKHVIKKTKTSGWIVVHPAKMQRDKNGKYPKPNLYDSSGSAHWYNKADNGFVTWRNAEDNEQSITIAKVKHGQYGELKEYPTQFNTVWRGFEIIDDFAQGQTTIL